MHGVLDLTSIDLSTDPEARLAVKDEFVEVEFAPAAGELASAVGTNAFCAGDAILRGSTGDRWCVSRDRFDAKYLPASGFGPGEAGRYRNRPLDVFAKRMPVAFTVSRSAGGDVLAGAAGDWLVQYAPGDHGIVTAARFAAVYRLLR